MRVPFQAQGPWAGMVVDARDPSTQLSYAVNSTFDYGVARQAKFTRAVGRPFDPPIEDMLTAYYVKHRDGMDRVIVVARRKLWIVSANGQRVDATGATDWEADTASDVSAVHIMTDASEWFVLATRLRDKLYRLAAETQRFEEFRAPITDESSAIRGGKVIAVFGDRLVFGGVKTPFTEIPHAVGWYGIKGPFDYTLPTSGYMALTDVPGRVTALVPVQDFLAVFKEKGAYILQKTFVTDIPFAAIPRLHTVGVSKPGHAVAVMQQSLIVFYAEETKRLYVWDLQRLEDVSMPVWRELSERSDPSLYYNEHTESLDVVYEDATFRFSLRGKWWSRVDVTSSAVYLPAIVHRLGLTIDELEGTIDEQPGRIDDYPAAVVTSEATYVNGGGFMVPDENAVGRTVWRTAPLVFPKPTTITAFEVFLRAPLGAIVSARYSLDDEGGNWSRWETLEQGDVNVGRYTWHFVETSRSFLFEVAVEGTNIELVRWGVEVVRNAAQEDEVPGGNPTEAWGLWSDWGS